MIGFDFADSSTAIKAMQAINSTIKNPWFAPAFFGPLVSGTIASLLSFIAGHTKTFFAIMIATITYFLGAFLPTILFSVPMNNELAVVLVPQIFSDADQIWQAYSVDWKFWNLVRTIASAISVTLTGLALLAANSNATSAKD